MRDDPAGICDMQIIVHNDDETPWQFVVDLVRSIFARSEAEERRRCAESC
jgi:ATP-dependent Clp protease adapter protein ClpS